MLQLIDEDGPNQKEMKGLDDPRALRFADSDQTVSLMVVQGYESPSTKINAELRIVRVVPWQPSARGRRSGLLRVYNTR